MSELVEIAARTIVARADGLIGTHFADCHLYHLPCFAKYVLDRGGDGE